MEQELEEQLRQMEVRLIATIKEEVVLKVREEVESKIILSINNLDHSLGSKIDKLDHSLVSKIDKLDHSLGSKIDKLDHSLGSKIDKLDHSLGSKIDKLDHSLGSKIDKRTSELKEEVKLVREEIAVGNLQTHELLSNIAGVLNSIDKNTR